MGTIAIKGLGKAFLKGRANPKKVKGDMEVRIPDEIFSIKKYRT